MFGGSGNNGVWVGGGGGGGRGCEKIEEWSDAEDFTAIFLSGSIADVLAYSGRHNTQGDRISR